MCKPQKTKENQQLEDQKANVLACEKQRGRSSQVGMRARDQII